MSDRAILEREIKGKLDSVLTAVFKWGGDAIEVLDPDGKILFVNAAFTKMTGFGLEEVKNQSLDAFLPNEFQVAAADTELWGCVFVNKQVFSGQIYRRTKKGDDRLFEVTVVPVLSEMGLLESAVVISRDITLRRREEQRKMLLMEQVAYLQKMESLGQLAGRFAHDFNNLLTSIMGNIDLVAYGATVQQQECLDDVSVALTRAVDLTQQVLLYSSGKTPCKTMLDANLVVSEMTALFKASLNANIALKFQLSSSLPNVFGDATQLVQVLMNLISNAAEAIGVENGTITVITNSCTITVDDDTRLFRNQRLEPGEYVSITVLDDGKGIKLEDLPKIFTPFFTSKKGVHGLGLSSLLGIIKNHHGDARVCSTLNSGSEFVVLLPAGTPEQEQIQKPSDKSSLRILLVDDDLLLRKVVVKSLRQFDIKTFQAADGQEGWDAYQNQGPFDLVLLDQIMPKMSGTALLSKIKGVNPGQKVAMCSGFMSKVDCCGDQDVRPDAIIEKPFTPQSLARRVMAIVDS